LSPAGAALPPHSSSSPACCLQACRAWTDARAARESSGRTLSTPAARVPGRPRGPAAAVAPPPPPPPPPLACSAWTAARAAAVSPGRAPLAGTAAAVALPEAPAPAPGPAPAGAPTARAAGAGLHCQKRALTRVQAAPARQQREGEGASLPPARCCPPHARKSGTSCGAAAARPLGVLGAGRLRRLPAASPLPVRRCCAAATAGPWRLGRLGRAPRGGAPWCRAPPAGGGGGPGPPPAWKGACTSTATGFAAGRWCRRNSARPGRAHPCRCCRCTRGPAHRTALPPGPAPAQLRRHPSCRSVSVAGRQAESSRGAAPLRACGNLGRETGNEWRRCCCSGILRATHLCSRERAQAAAARLLPLQRRGPASSPSHQPRADGGVIDISACRCGAGQLEPFDPVGEVVRAAARCRRPGAARCRGRDGCCYVAC
jgi:hypothetical protein